MDEERQRLKARIEALIDRLSGGGRDDEARDTLLLDLARWQVGRIEPYRRLLTARGVGAEGAAAPLDLPAVPTDVFKHVRMASHAAGDDVRAFLTSGTTTSVRGRHVFRDLSLYERAARAAARHALFPDVERIQLVIAAPGEVEAPHSSLSFMLARFVDWFAEGAVAWAWRDGAVDVEALESALRSAEAQSTPVALLGTTFAFVHADDRLGDAHFALPPGSRIMQTGGFKGVSREVDPADMRRQLSARYGVKDHSVIAEYGMTELSSQMYETTLRAPTEPRRLWVPGWMRATPVDPESLTPVADGEVGILRVDDVANLDSVCAIQTSDLARCANDGIELLGRAPGATPRGCSLALDAALGDHAQ